MDSASAAVEPFKVVMGAHLRRTADEMAKQVADKLAESAPVGEFPTHTILAVPAGAGKTMAVLAMTQSLLRIQQEASNWILLAGLHDVGKSAPRFAGIVGSAHANILDHDQAGDSSAAKTDGIRLHDLDYRTPLERELGVAPRSSIPTTADLVPGPMPVNRVCRILATTPLRLPFSLRITTDPWLLAVAVWREVLRRIMKIVGRLVSTPQVDPVPRRPPGQLVTAYPFLTRGPTPLRATTFLSVLRRPVVA